MTTTKATIAVMVILTVVLILYDIYVAIEPTPGDTISEVIRAASHKYPIIPFALGVLIGHWFWGRE